MKVKIPYLVEDQFTAASKGFDPVERITIEGDVFLDGPVSDRVAVLDFDTSTGSLRQGASLDVPTGRRTLASYVVDEADIESSQFNQVSVFGTVLRTMAMFEKDDVLGRPLAWAFDGPQLLVVPRAGEWANAFYERESRSLQFFSFQSTTEAHRAIHTSLSSDIISHEVAHAILDGIAPSLYDAITPQSLALHEAVADLVAFIMSMDSRRLRAKVLEQTGGDLSGPTAFSAVAQEFGRALGTGRLYLRSLRNEKTLLPDDDSVDEFGDPNRVRRDEPHALSQVLSGALYDVFVRGYRETWDGRLASSGRNLALASERFKRLVLRALDYLPPGEVSFADYGRAIMASDQASYPSVPRERSWLAAAFARRGITSDPNALDVTTSFEASEIGRVDLDALVESDWQAYDFAARHRRFLKIPANAPFDVMPRLDVTKTLYGDEATSSTREVIFKVSWQKEERNAVDGLPDRRVVRVGTTLVIDRDTRLVRALLSTDRSATQRADRDLMVRRLRDSGSLDLGPSTRSTHGKPLPSVVQAEDLGGVLRIRGVARTLHVAPIGGE